MNLHMHDILHSIANYVRLNGKEYLCLKGRGIMTKSVNKADLIWLADNTEVANRNLTADDCITQDVIFHIYRPHHREKFHQIFAEYQTVDMEDKNNNKYVRVIDFTISDLYQLMREYGGSMFLNATDGRAYYVPIDKKKYRHIFNRASAKILANLSTNQKINILKSLAQKCYMSARGSKKSQEALSKKTDKLLALLQIRIPPQFIENEMRKVRLITAEIAKIPNIKEKLEDFSKLTSKKQQELLTKVCEITAKYNNIDMPNLKFLSQKQIDRDEGLADWVSAEAFAYENNVCINKDFLKKIDGPQALSLVWHETTHIAQAYGDYSQYPLVEDIFNQSLDFLQQMPNTYIFHPQEKVVFALEKQFIEEIVKNTRIKTNDETFSYSMEYDITTQYLNRSANIKS